MIKILEGKFCEDCGARATTYSKYGYLCAPDLTWRHEAGEIISREFGPYKISMSKTGERYVAVCEDWECSGSGFTLVSALDNLQISMKSTNNLRVTRLIDKAIDELMALSDEEWDKTLDEAGYSILSQNTTKIFSE